jgi:hypothetical protein
MTGLRVKQEKDWANQLIQDVRGLMFAGLCGVNPRHKRESITAFVRQIDVKTIPRLSGNANYPAVICRA